MENVSDTTAVCQTQGFLFAFLCYSRLKHPTMLQRVVKRFIDSDLIHVAMVPVPYALVTARRPHAPLRIETGPHAYTAFMWAGFELQPTDHVLDGTYDYVFLSVPDTADYARGLEFLRGLNGANYNYSALLLTLFSRSVKATHHEFPNWITNEHPFFDQYLAQEEEEQAQEAHGEKHKHGGGGGSSGSGGTAKERIFCSQMGLLLCYACNALPHHTYDPASCLPSELLVFLTQNAPGAMDAPRARILTTQYE